MSHKFKYIEKVIFDGVNGKIGDAYIYNMSYTQGFSSSPAKLVINELPSWGVKQYPTIFVCFFESTV